MAPVTEGSLSAAGCRDSAVVVMGRVRGKEGEDRGRSSRRRRGSRRGHSEVAPEGRRVRVWVRSRRGAAGAARGIVFGAARSLWRGGGSPGRAVAAVAIAQAVTDVAAIAVAVIDVATTEVAAEARLPRRRAA